jgi:hypothetical protein
VSAVIYAAIVVMWAVVLVPMWLRRHDAATESRSVDRFSTAMRTLSRRTTAAPGRRYVVMPRRGESAPTVHVSGASADTRPARTTTVRPGRSLIPVRSKSPRSLVARRRRLLLVALGITFLTFVLAVAGVLSWPLQVVFDVILVAFCIHLRAQAKRAATVARQRSRAAAAPAAGRPAAARPAVPGRAVPPAAARPARPPQPAAPLPDVAVAATGTDGMTEDWADDEDTWEPVPVPPPTYTMKPPAPAYEADPTYSQPAYDPAARAAAQGAAQAQPDNDLDEILDRRWAVND